MEGEFHYAGWLPVLLGLVSAGVVFVWRIALQRLRRGRPLLRRRRRRPVPWGLGGAVLAAFGLSNALLVLLFLPGGRAEVVAGPGEAVDLTLSTLLGHVMAYALLSGIAIAGLRVGGATAADFGWPYPGPGKQTSAQHFVNDLVIGVAAWLVILPVVYFVQIAIVALLELPSGHPAIEQMIHDPSPQVLAAVALMAVVVAPLYEEFAFRVLLQGWLERVAGSRRAWWPIVVSSAAFAVSHTGQGFAPVPLFLLSLGFGYVYRQTHRFAACTAMHAAFNGFSLLVAMGIQPLN